jgi:hypothetical protein
MFGGWGQLLQNAWRCIHRLSPSLLIALLPPSRFFIHRSVKMYPNAERQPGVMLMRVDGEAGGKLLWHDSSTCMHVLHI